MSDKAFYEPNWEKAKKFLDDLGHDENLNDLNNLDNYRGSFPDVYIGPEIHLEDGKYEIFLDVSPRDPDQDADDLDISTYSWAHAQKLEGELPQGAKIEDDFPYLDKFQRG